jgi:hypothetical protein
MMQNRLERKKLIWAFIALYLCVIGSIITTSLMWYDVSEIMEENRDNGARFYDNMESIHSDMLSNDSTMLLNQDTIKSMIK